MAYCVTLCISLLNFLMFHETSATTCYLCDSSPPANWESVIPGANSNQKDCLSNDTNMLGRFKMTCPGDPAEWGGCSLDIFYADKVTRTGPITRVHRSCYPASSAVGTADGSCLPDQMETGSVWCYCAADSCNYYSSTQSAGSEKNPSSEHFSAKLHGHNR